MPCLIPALLLCLGVLGPGGEVHAPADPAADSVFRLVLLGSHEEDRLRLAHLMGEAPPHGFLIRSPSTLPLEGGEWQTVAGTFKAAVMVPELHAVWNSDIPFSLNEGPMWAGRGLSTRTSVGAGFRYRTVTLLMVPQLVREQNREFQTTSYPEPGMDRLRHPFASLFHYPPQSMDLPQRFGHRSRTFARLGQSSLTVRTGSVAFGAATENLWWGPGIRNGLLMSASAPGIPHLFLSTAEPLETPIGTVEARWMVGRLQESDFFDFVPGNDHRSLSSLVVVVSPAFEPNLSLGLARSVFAPSGGAIFPVTSAFDVLRSVGRPAQEEGEGLLEPARDQLFVLFARWVFPEAGFEAYGEWGRQEQPKNLRDFMELPNHSRGYTAGLQFARDVPRLVGTRFRLQAEVTNLEPSTSFRVRNIGEWYASRTVPQGYTHRGRAIGAAIGPSGSSQWIAGDLFGERWHGGLFGGRIRWENEARSGFRPEFRRADVSLFVGIRGGWDPGPVTVSAEYTSGARLNYLFQAEPDDGPEDHRGVDIANHTVRLTLSVRSLLR